MEYDYEKLLKKARSELPESVLKTERFEIPKVKGFIQGQKTIMSNFSQIASAFHRPQEHLLKFLQRELATPALIDGPRLILNRRIKAEPINQKIEQYANLFVICPDCGKPDTKLVKEDKVTSIKCLACGAKHPIKTKI